MSGAGSLVCSGFWVWAKATPMPAIKTRLSRVDRLRFVMFFSLIDCGHSTDCKQLANGHLDIAEYKTGLFAGAINQPFFCQTFFCPILLPYWRIVRIRQKIVGKRMADKKIAFLGKVDPRIGHPTRAINHKPDFKSHHFTI
jgi:hypothetical protein